jgi:hypothetical protein
VQFPASSIVVCEQSIVVTNGMYYRFALAASERIQEDKSYKNWANILLSSVHISQPESPHRVSNYSHQQAADFVRQALSSLKDYDGQFKEIALKYPGNWQADQPFYLEKYGDAKNVLSLSSEQASIDLNLCPVGKNWTLKQLVDDQIESWNVRFQASDYVDVDENVSCTVAGHPGQKLLIRLVPEWDMAKPVERTTSYFTIVNGVSYNFTINVEDDQYPQFQQLIDTILSSYKIH